MYMYMIYIHVHTHTHDVHKQHTEMSEPGAADGRAVCVDLLEYVLSRQVARADEIGARQRVERRDELGAVAPADRAAAAQHPLSAAVLRADLAEALAV